MSRTHERSDEKASAVLEIEVACAYPDRQRIVSLSVTAGASLDQAISQSGLRAEFPELEISDQNVGVFGQPRKLADLVKAGDRVEIYRPLELDPKQARRLRAMAGAGD